MLDISEYPGPWPGGDPGRAKSYGKPGRTGEGKATGRKQEFHRKKRGERRGSRRLRETAGIIEKTEKAADRD